MSEPTLYREATRDEIAMDDLGVVSAVDVYTMDVVPVEPTVIVKVGDVWDDWQYLPNRFERGTIVALVAIGTWKEGEPE